MARAAKTSSSKRTQSAARTRAAASTLSSRLVRKSALPLALAAGAGVIAVGVWMLPNRTDGAKIGVGANGFSVYEMKGADLGITNVVNRATISEELGAHAKSVEKPQKSGVLNFNGNKGQTATYAFKTPQGETSHFYADVMVYKSKAAYETDDVFGGTLDVGTVDGLPARAMHAATIDKEREYAILFTKDLKSYKFALTQPDDKITISEGDAHAILKRIAERANLAAIK